MSDFNNKCLIALVYNTQQCSNNNILTSVCYSFANYTYIAVSVYCEAVVGDLVRGVPTQHEQHDIVTCPFLTKTQLPLQTEQ